MLHDPSSPRTLGSYTLLRELGRGGQGTVWLAEDQKLKRRVALKVLATAPGALSHDRLARFQREAEAAARLDDPNICALLDAGDVNGVPFLAFRYLEGHTLAERIAHVYERRQGFAPRSAGTPVTGAAEYAIVAEQTTTDPSSREGVLRIARTFEKIARALHKAHERGLVHRDVKPGNIMILPDGEPVLLDFGLARDELAEELSLTNSGDLLGTPAYMSPEQLTAQRIPLDRRTDVYSLGATLYEALTLHRPFAAPTRADLYQRILTSEPSPARSHNQQVPRDLQVVVETAMDKDRNRRYQTALDFAEDLRRFREFEPVQARPIGNLLRLRRWAQRHPALATGVVLLTLGMAVSLAMSLQLDAALRSSENNERIAQDTLAAAFLEKADRAIDDGEHGAAAIFAAAALVNDPNNPNSPHFRPITDSEREAEERVALMHSRHYEAEAGRRLAWLRTLQPPSPLSSSGWFAFSPAEPRIAVGTREGPVCLWDLDRDAAPIVLSATGEPGSGWWHLRYSPDGSLLAQAMSQSVRLWDVASRELRAELPMVEPPTAILFLAEDRLAIGDSAGWVRVWSLHGTEFVQQRAFGSRVAGLAYSRVVDRLAVVLGPESSTAWLVDGELRDAVALRVSLAATDAAFSPDGATLVVAGRESVLWTFTLATGTRSGLPMSDRPLSVQFSPDGTLLAHGVAFGAAGLRAAGDQRILDGAHGAFGAQRRVGFSRDGRTLATSGRDTDVRLWRVVAPDLRRRVVEHQAVISTFSMSEDGTSVVTVSKGDGEMRYWSVPAGGEIGAADFRTIRPPDEAGPRAVWVTLVPNSSRVVITDADGRVEVRELESGVSRIIRASRPGEYFGGTMTSTDPEGTLVYLPDVDGRILRWNLHEDRFLPPLQIGDARVFVVAISRDGRFLASGSWDGTIAIWRRGGGDSPVLVAGRDEGGITGLAFSPDGSELASAGAGSRIRLWDVATGALRHELEGHLTWVNRVAYSPEGRFLLSSSDDYTVRLWDLAARRLLQVFRCVKEATELQFTADGRFFYINDGHDLTRYTVTVDERIDDPRQLLRDAEQRAGVRLEGLRLSPLK